jgi:DNA-binding beta-propeller fold protein YncE
VPAGASPVNLRASPDGRWVWVTNFEDGTVWRLDTASA